MSKISILIPTFNRAESLRAVLPSYCLQKNVSEIIIVNDGSNDSTPEVVRCAAANSIVPIRLISHPCKRGQQYSRHTAIDAAKTEWILFGEDDVWLQPDYAANLLSQAEALRADAIAGRLLTACVPDVFLPENLPVPRSECVGPIFDVNNFAANYEACPGTPERALYLHSIALIRRNIFEQFEFDKWYRGNAHREETDFYLSLNESGRNVFFAPSAYCYHLRGPISAYGGQRINRFVLEYWHFINTWYMVRKHWRYLSRNYGFSSAAWVWIIAYSFRRQYSQLVRLISGDAKSKFAR